MCDFIQKATPFKACCDASNGVAAIDTARECGPNLIIVDLSMPMLHGVETASSLRQIVPDAKIIGLAMIADELGKSPIAAAGFDIIVSKRDGLAKLAETIKRLLPDNDWA